MRVKPLDDFTIQLHHQTQNAVRCGMLWAKVNRVVLDDVIARGRREILLHTHALSPVALGFRALRLTTSLFAALPAPVCVAVSVVLGVGGGAALPAPSPVFSSPGRI